MESASLMDAQRHGRPCGVEWGLVGRKPGPPAGRGATAAARVAGVAGGEPVGVGAAVRRSKVGPCVCVCRGSKNGLRADGRFAKINFVTGWFNGSP